MRPAQICCLLFEFQTTQHLCQTLCGWPPRCADQHSCTWGTDVCQHFHLGAVIHGQALGTEFELSWVRAGPGQSQQNVGTSPKNPPSPFRALGDSRSESQQDNSQQGFPRHGV